MVRMIILFYARRTAPFQTV